LFLASAPHPGSRICLIRSRSGAVRRRIPGSAGKNSLRPDRLADPHDLQKQFRNFQIQKARLDRKRAKAMAELRHLQAQRKDVDAMEQPSEPQTFDDEELFAALDAALLPPSLQSLGKNGFDFSNAENLIPYTKAA